jgi:hypothetical protein
LPTRSCLAQRWDSSDDRPERTAEARSVPDPFTFDFTFFILYLSIPGCSCPVFVCFRYSAQPPTAINDDDVIFAGITLCSRLDVPFIGDEWDRPVAAWESAILVRILHRIAIAIEGAFPVLAPVRLRWMAAPVVFIQIAFGFLVAWLFSKIFSTI